MIPYKLYINWTGKYTAGSMSGTFTDITDEVYDLDISVSRRRDTKSIAIIRHFAQGSFVVKDANYDLLQTAIANGLPELIIRIDKYSTVAVDYVEVWRGSAETRPSEMDDNRKVAKISKFNTIDKYSDVLTTFTKTWEETFTQYMTIPDGMVVDGLPANPIVSSVMLFSFLPATTNNFLEINWTAPLIQKYGATQVSKMIAGSYDADTDTYDYYFLINQDAQFGQRGLWAAPARTMKLTDDTTLSFSLKKITEIYRIMFNLYWYYDEITFDSNDYDAIQYKHPSQLFGIGTIDYTAESKDFAAYSYLDSTYFIREVFQMSPFNLDVDHITQFYEYDLLAEEEFTYSLGDVITDIESLFTEGYDDKDIVIFTANQTAASEGDIEERNNINGAVRDVPNGRCMLSLRMRDDLNNFRQLDSATFNGSVQSLNPNIALPSIRQEKFPIELNLLSDLDFAATIETSIGNTFANEVQWELKSNAIYLFCQK